MSPSTGVSCSTEASGSKPKSNTKKDWISQTSSSNKKKNIVEDQPRIAKSSLNNVNHISKIVGNENVKHSMLNANFELVCATCHEFMFDDIHDLCVSYYLNDVNAHVKSKSMKSRNAKTKKKKMIISTNVVPLRKTISTTQVKQIQPSSNKSGKLNNTTNKRSSSKSKTVGRTIVLWYLDSGCSKHMTEQCFHLINFVRKILGTVRFGNDQIAKIMGYGDYQLGNVTISQVYYVEGLRHNLFFVGQLCNSDLEVAFWKHTCYIRNLDGADLLSRSRDTNLYTISLDDMMKSSPICLLSKASETKNETSVARTPQQNGVVEKQNWTLVKAACTMLIFSKAPLFLWAEAVSTACYTQNRSLIRLWYNKAPYELLHDKKPNLSYLHVFGSLRYPTNDSEDLGKLKAKANIGIFVGYDPANKAF
ncbi:integrase, catalytic region, zinc finger, CCHC-type containing protein [Tanacetum coccineum]